MFPAYLFIIALEVFFFHPDKESRANYWYFDQCFLLASYADDSTFFLGYCNLVKILVNIFQAFLQFSDLKPNSKCEIADIGLLKGTIEAVAGLKLVDLTVDTMKILGVHFSCNKEAQIRKNILS